MFTLSVLASGNGTDLAAILEEMEAGLLPGVTIKNVISDQANSGALEKAEAVGIPGIFIPRSEKTREAFEEELIQAIGEVNLVCLIGFMRILGPKFIRHFGPEHIINVHPALLPKFGGPGFYGMKVHEAVLANGEMESGMTIHHVDEQVDHGEIVLQKKVPILPDDTPETLKSRIQELEKKAYPEAIRILMRKFE